MRAVFFALVHFTLAIADKTGDSITVRSFTLLTSTGESVFHKDFDRRRLATNSDASLALKFKAVQQQFEFKFQRTHSIFAPDAIIEMTGNVRGIAYTQTLVHENTLIFKPRCCTKRGMAMWKYRDQTFYHFPVPTTTGQSLSSITPSQTAWCFSMAKLLTSLRIRICLL